MGMEMESDGDERVRCCSFCFVVGDRLSAIYRYIDRYRYIDIWMEGCMIMVYGVAMSAVAGLSDGFEMFYGFYCM